MVNWYSKNPNTHDCSLEYQTFEDCSFPLTSPWLCSQRGQLIQMSIRPRTFWGSISLGWSIISKPIWWESVSPEHSTQLGPASLEGRWPEAELWEMPWPRTVLPSPSAQLQITLAQASLTVEGQDSEGWDVSDVRGWAEEPLVFLHSRSQL